MGRFGTPDEIATAAVFLAYDESSFVKGTELFVDGCCSSPSPLLLSVVMVDTVPALLWWEPADGSNEFLNQRMA
jgi:hypothetical protein